MYLPYSKCDLGKRCAVKTDDNYVFRKFTLLCAISNSKCVGATLYKEGDITKERFVEFLDANIFNKYKNHLIILDNAGSHKTNAIEQYFNQIKHYLKLNKKVLKYDEFVIEIKNAIKQVKKENYYFENSYNKDAYKDYVKKDSTLKRTPKNYKN
jgi:hypothetical protein